MTIRSFSRVYGNSVDKKTRRDDKNQNPLVNPITIRYMIDYLTWSLNRSALHIRNDKNALLCINFNVDRDRIVNFTVLVIHNVMFPIQIPILRCFHYFKTNRATYFSISCVHSFVGVYNLRFACYDGVHWNAVARNR